MVASLDSHLPLRKQERQPALAERPQPCSSAQAAQRASPWPRSRPALPRLLCWKPPACPPPAPRCGDQLRPEPPSGILSLPSCSVGLFLDLSPPSPTEGAPEATRTPLSICSAIVSHGSLNQVSYNTLGGSPLLFLPSFILFAPGMRLLGVCLISCFLEALTWPGAGLSTTLPWATPVSLTPTS